MINRPPQQIFTARIQGTVIGHHDEGHTPSGRIWVKIRIIHRTGYLKDGAWVAAAPMEFEVTCWDEHKMALARSLKPGTDITVTVKKFFPYLDRSDTPIINITPAEIVIMRAPNRAPDRVRKQRSGDMVVSPHGERIAADSWPDVVTDLELVHHP